MVWCIKTYIIAYVKIQIKWFIKVYYPLCRVARCDIKGSDGTMLNPIFWKKVQGQKHPGRWGIVEHQIPTHFQMLSFLFIDYVIVAIVSIQIVNLMYNFAPKL